jgi:multidrug efflux pump subunit AcrB
MKGPNLSAWSLAHQQMVLYLIIVLMAAGVISYLNLGREEDPAFTIKTMLIVAQWPGASAEETARQITDRIEKKLAPYR